MNIWPANDVMFNLVEKIKNRHHVPRLKDATIAVSMIEKPAFSGERFNWGKTRKFNLGDKIWQNKQYDFEIVIPTESWNLLSEYQKEAYLDLRISCMEVEYEIETIEENGKKIPVKDKWGRKVLTNVIKLDKEGFPKYKVTKSDLTTYQDNVSRYGCWIQDLIDLKSAFKDSEFKIKIEEIQ